MAVPRFRVKSKKVRMIDIRGRKISGKVVAQVTARDLSARRRKRFVLQKIEFSDGRKRLRIGYYIVSKKGRVKNKFVWGQYAPLFNKPDLMRLIAKAKRKEIL